MSNEITHVKTGEGFRIDRANAEVALKKDLAKLVGNSKSDAEKIKHLEGYLRNPLLARVLSEKSRFETEALGFYGFSYNLEGVLKMIKEDPKKDGTYPKDLVDIVDPFDREGLDLKKLNYDIIRSRYKSLELAEENNGLYALGGVGALCAGMLASLFYICTTGDFLPLVSVSGSLSGLISVACGGTAAVKALTSMSKNPILSSSEFGKLYSKTEKADHFINKCRDDLRRESLLMNEDIQYRM